MDIPPPQAGDFGEPRVLVPAPQAPRFAHLAWPKIVRAADRALVLAYAAGHEHTRQGCPAVSISTDDGETFSAPNVLAEFGEGQPFYHCGNVALGLAGDRALVLLAMAMTRKTEANTILGWRSTDSGRTWQPSDVATLAGRVGSVYGHVFTIPGRGLAVFGHFRNGAALAEEGLWMALSTDHGQSWGEPEIVSRTEWFEPAFWFSSGRIVCLARDNGARQYPQLVSDDLCRTWSEGPSSLGDRTQMPSPFIITKRQDPSRLYALQTLRKRDAGIYLWSADVAKLDWRREATVVKLPTDGDYGYPWMTQLDDDAWMLAFYCGLVDGANSIWGLKLKLR